MNTSPINTTAATATQLVVTSEPPLLPSTVTVGGTFGLTVTAEDQFGNVDKTFGANGQTVTVTLASNPGSVNFIPVTVAAVNGVATIHRPDVERGRLRLHVHRFQQHQPHADHGATTAVTAVPATAVKVVLISQPPSSVAAGTPFGFTAKVEDTFGNTVTGYVGTVTVAAAPGNTLGGATFTPVTVQVQNGVADFTGLLSLNQPSTSDALQLSSGNLTTATTNTFTVTAATATKLVVTNGPTPSNAVVGGSITLTVQAEDAVQQPRFDLLR